jgi:hypothetical protein
MAGYAIRDAGVGMIAWRVLREVGFLLHHPLALMSRAGPKSDRRMPIPFTHLLLRNWQAERERDTSRFDASAESTSVDRRQVEPSPPFQFDSPCAVLPVPPAGSALTRYRAREFSAETTVEQRRCGRGATRIGCSGRLSMHAAFGPCCWSCFSGPLR